MKKILLYVLILSTFSQNTHSWGYRWGWGGGPYWGYYTPSAGEVIAGAFADTALTTAALASRPKSDAEIEYADRKNQRQIIEKDIRQAQKEKNRLESHNRKKNIKENELNENKKRIEEINQKIDDLRIELRSI